MSSLACQCRKYMFKLVVVDEYVLCGMFVCRNGYEIYNHEIQKNWKCALYRGYIDMNQRRWYRWKKFPWRDRISRYFTLARYRKTISLFRVYVEIAIALRFSIWKSFINAWRQGVIERREEIFSRPSFAEANHVCHCPQLLQQTLLPFFVIISPFANTKNDTHLSTSLQTALKAIRYIDQNIKCHVSDISTHADEDAIEGFWTDKPRNPTTTIC